MKNFEALATLASRRQTGYTTAAIKSGAIILVPYINDKRMFPRGIASVPSDGFFHIDGPIIPDNHLLSLAVSEAEAKMRQQAGELHRQKERIEYLERSQVRILEVNQEQANKLYDQEQVINDLIDAQFVDAEDEAQHIKNLEELVDNGLIAFEELINYLMKE